MSRKVYFNNDWGFTSKFDESLLQADYDESLLERVRLPHTVKVTPFNYFDESEYAFVSGYRKTFKAPSDWQGKSVRITFCGAAHSAVLYLNGTQIYKHCCGYSAFSADLTDALKYGEDNTITVRLDSNETLNQPPFGFVIDYMTYGGIYRDVYFEISDKRFIADSFHYSAFDKENISLCSEITLSAACKNDLSNLELREYVGSVEVGRKTVDGEKVKLSNPLKDVVLWNLDDPKLYDIRVELVDKESGTVIDESTVRFGFRKSEFKKDGYYLNGKKVKIRGLNRHQSYAYVGYAMPASMQIEDARILKEELGVNAVRTSHYPQSHDFIGKCDELGLLVFTEIPGWQHIGDDDWKARAVQNVKDMVTQYRNHPSIILWGVRINESADCDDFYKETNEAAHTLDPTRPTGGVRAIRQSNLFEDVYTYNDFVHEGDNIGCLPKKKVTSDVKKAYLISEYNGHMYPTKTFDDEEQRREHAKRHANVLDAVAGHKDIAGAFGWCMNDYNTHKDFGSGDRICYHGVLDMFRNFKTAAYVYAAEGCKEPVLYLSSSMDIGEHPACNRGITWIYTNADSVRMYKNDRFIKEYKAQDSPYKNLKHGPIMVDDFIGDAVEKGEEGSNSYKKDLKDALNIVAVYGMSHPPKRFYALIAKLVLIHRFNPANAMAIYGKYVGDWGGAATEYRFEAIKDGKVVKTLTKKPVKNLKFEVATDHTELKEGATYDVASVRIKAVDEFDNIAFFFNEPIKLKAEGSVELIGEELVGFKGGLAGAYVRTKAAGPGRLIIENSQCGSVSIDFNVTEEPTEMI